MFKNSSVELTNTHLIHINCQRINNLETYLLPKSRWKYSMNQRCETYFEVTEITCAIIL